MKKNVKFLIGIVFFIMMTINIIQIIYPVNVFGWASNLIDNFDNTDDFSSNSQQTVTNTVGSVIGIVSVVAAGIALIMLIVLGISYVVKSPGEKAQVKETIQRYVTGIVMMFGASGLLKLAQMFIEANLNKQV